VARASKRRRRPLESTQSMAALLKRASLGPVRDEVNRRWGPRSSRTARDLRIDPRAHPSPRRVRMTMSPMTLDFRLVSAQVSKWSAELLPPTSQRSTSTTRVAVLAHDRRTSRAPRPGCSAAYVGPHNWAYPRLPAAGLRQIFVTTLRKTGPCECSSYSIARRPSPTLSFYARLHVPA